MAENADSFELGRIDQKLTRSVIAHLSQELNLRFRIIPGDEVVAHFEIANADDVSVMLLCTQLEDKTGYGIYLHGAGTDPHSELVTEYQTKVDEALEPLKST